MATTPKGIWFPDGGTNADFVSIFSTMASSVDAALGDFTYDSGWIDVPTSEMVNGWETYNSGSFQVKYRKVGKLVSISGLIRYGEIGTMFTLPTEFRPSGAFIFACFVNGNKLARVQVSTDGTLALTTIEGTLGNNWISLNNVTFLVD